MNYVNFSLLLDILFILEHLDSLLLPHFIGNEPVIYVLTLLLAYLLIWSKVSSGFLKMFVWGRTRSAFVWLMRVASVGWRRPLPRFHWTMGVILRGLNYCLVLQFIKCLFSSTPLLNVKLHSADEVFLLLLLLRL